MSDFCLLVTSRGRPESWTRLARAIEATTTDVDVWLILDDDDPTAGDYPEMIETERFVGARLGHIGSLNRYARIAAGKYAIVGQLGDDHLPQTRGWDQRIRAELVLPGIAYGNDLLQGENLPTAVFFSAEIIQATGKFAPEGLWHLYADNYWRDLGAGAGVLHYLPDVVIEHLHPIAAKSEWDETYIDSNNSVVDHGDALVWEHYQESGQLAEDIEKVKAL